MIYLLSQLLLSLALAALLGGALGWLAHRARANASFETLRQELTQRTRLLAEARGDVQMLGEDFEELRNRSREEINSLRAENRELPVLADNLEKSQLMVRQLMQRHDAQLRELTARNEELAEQLAMMRAQADLRERAHAELESARLREGGDGIDSDTDVESASPSTPHTAANASDRDASNHRTSPDAAAPPPPLSWASRRLESEEDGVADDTDDADQAYGADGIGEGAGTLDEVMEVDANLAAELRDDDDPIGSPSAGDGDGFEEARIAPLTGGTDGGTAGVEEEPDVGEDVQVLPTVRVPPVDEEQEVDDSRSGASVGAREEAYEDEDDEANATLAIDILPADLELAFDLDDRDAPLFDPVDRQDDLQRLFGIGPITEKALNTLGITSYSQLAELERHEIEKIADALQIVPERIEKDDWVGNARRQLEDVLQQL